MNPYYESNPWFRSVLLEWSLDISNPATNCKIIPERDNKKPERQSDLSRFRIRIRTIKEKKMTNRSQLMLS